MKNSVSLVDLAKNFVKSLNFDSARPQNVFLAILTHPISCGYNRQDIGVKVTPGSVCESERDPIEGIWELVSKRLPLGL